jgi:predicted amidohydrolase YtcJ
VVALFDAGNDQADEPLLAALAQLAAAGQLPLRYDASVMITLPHQIAGAVARLERLREKYAGGRLRINTVKILFDGVSEIGTAFVLEPYVDGSRGATVLDGAQLQGCC